MPVESSSFETVICICRSVEFPTDWLFEEILRVLKRGGTILVHKNPQSIVGETDKITSALEHKLLLVGFLEVGVLKSMVPSEVQSFGALILFAEALLKKRGIRRDYTTWYLHGEGDSKVEGDDDDDGMLYGDMFDMIKDAYPQVVRDRESSGNEPQEPNGDAKKFYRLLEE
ncbi:hypothetical protein CMV_026689, partial [Castanea mollissima]